MSESKRSIVPAWTSVKESLPDDALTVLIVTPDCDEPVTVGYIDGETWSNGYGESVSVTHWMELPEPPL
jgi:hypothetical protein